MSRLGIMPSLLSGGLGSSKRNAGEEARVVVYIVGGVGVGKSNLAALLSEELLRSAAEDARAKPESGEPTLSPGPSQRSSLRASLARRLRDKEAESGPARRGAVVKMTFLEILPQSQVDELLADSQLPTVILLMFSLASQFSYFEVTEQHAKMARLSQQVALVGNAGETGAQEKIDHSLPLSFAQSQGTAYFPISTSTGSGVPALLAFLRSHALAVCSPKRPPAAPQRGVPASRERFLCRIGLFRSASPSGQAVVMDESNRPHHSFHQSKDDNSTSASASHSHSHFLSHSHSRHQSSLHSSGTWRGDQTDRRGTVSEMPSLPQRSLSPSPFDKARHSVLAQPLPNPVVLLPPLIATHSSSVPNLEPQSSRAPAVISSSSQTEENSREGMRRSLSDSSLNATLLMVVDTEEKISATQETSTTQEAFTAQETAGLEPFLHPLTDESSSGTDEDPLEMSGAESDYMLHSYSSGYLPDPVEDDEEASAFPSPHPFSSPDDSLATASLEQQRSRLRASTPVLLERLLLKPTRLLSKSQSGSSSAFQAPRVASPPMGCPSPEAALQHSSTSDWNSRYQEVMKSYLAISDTGLLEQSSTIRELMQLAFDFIDVAKLYGRIIISERHLDRKTIAPTNLGGVAGGEKYVVGNILFKFAIDSKGLFQSDWAATKVAGAELRGCMAHANCKLPQIRLPLMALVDFMGHRLIAMSLLPIDHSTLIYGTSDGCHHVYCDPELSQHMATFATRLNLQPHWCGSGPQRRFLHSACDIEGHRGQDDHLYLIDFSRTFPPTKPDRSIQNGHLFQLFRREWVVKYAIPLCPDAFSGFVKEDPRRREYCKAIKTATRALFATAPAFATSDTITAAIYDGIRNGSLDKVDITQHMHAAGFNLRFIGVILPFTFRSKPLAILLVVEALARVLKNELRARLNNLNKTLRVVLMTPYRQFVVDFLNSIFGRFAAELYTHIVNELRLKFVISNGSLSQIFPLMGINIDFKHVPPEDQPPGLGTPPPDPLPELLHSFVVSGIVSQMPVKYLLLNRLSDLASIRMTKSCLENSMRGFFWNSNTPFDIMDLKNLRVRVKHTNLASAAKANFLYAKALKALQMRSSQEAIELLNKSKKRFQIALRSDPKNPDLLRGIALIHYKLTEFSQLQGKNMANVSFSPYDPKVAETDQSFLRALEANPNDPNTLHHYARFKIRCNLFEPAEKLFLAALEIDPNNSMILKAYGFFLSEMGEFKLAEMFFSRANQLLALLERVK